MFITLPLIIFIRIDAFAIITLTLLPFIIVMLVLYGVSYELCIISVYVSLYLTLIFSRLLGIIV
jgi:hypothetical protein